MSAEVLDGVTWRLTGTYPTGTPPLGEAVIILKMTSVRRGRGLAPIPAKSERAEVPL